MYNKQIRVTTKSGMGDAVANLYRHALASQTKAWTPAAFHIGSSNAGKTTLLKTEANTTSDMIQVLSTLLGCTYSIDSNLVGDTDIVAISIKVTGEVYLRDLEGSTNIAPGVIRVHGRNRDVKIFELQDGEPVIFTIIFVKQCGDMTKDEYRELITNSPNITIREENLCIFDGTPNIYSSLNASVDTDGVYDIVTISADINMELDSNFFEEINDNLIEALSKATIMDIDK